MKINKQLATVLLLLGCSYVSLSQNLLDLLDKEQIDSIGYVSPAFKMTRISFGHSTEVRSKGVLELFTATRFWNTPSERSESFLADRMSTRIALEYGLTNRLSMAVGVTTFTGVYDTYLKYKLRSQKHGTNKSLFNITFLQGVSYNNNVIGYNGTTDLKPFSFTTQLLISKKISSNFSLQITPSYVYKNAYLPDDNQSNYVALGIGGRYKIGAHVSLVSEYYQPFNPTIAIDTYPPFSLGLNWEIGDVLLQFMLTNAVDMVEDTFITQTRHNFNFKDPNLNFGFNATYVFHLKNSLKKKRD